MLQGLVGIGCRKARTTGLAQGTAVPQAGSSAEPGTGRTPAVAVLDAVRSSLHWNETGDSATALKLNVAPRPAVEEEASVSVGLVASTVKRRADTRA